MQLFMEKKSGLHRVLHDKLKWYHIKFLGFIKTSLALSEFKFTITRACATKGAIVGMKEKEYLTQCYEEMYASSSVVS